MYSTVPSIEPLSTTRVSISIGRSFSLASDMRQVIISFLQFHVTSNIETMPSCRAIGDSLEVLPGFAMILPCHFLVWGFHELLKPGSRSLMVFTLSHVLMIIARLGQNTIAKTSQISQIEFDYSSTICMKTRFAGSKGNRLA